MAGRRPRPLAIVLVSGGMDSAVCLGEAARTCELALLHANYGQRTQERELAAFHALADHYCAGRRLVADISCLRAVGGSSLLDPGAPVETGLPVPGAPVPSTYVPFRNAHLLSLGVSWAEVCGAQRLYVGAVQEDGSGYPDCRQEFYKAFGRAVRAGTKPPAKLRIHTPLIRLGKADIVRRGLELGVPLHLTWSCYTEQEVACGVCESCRLRLRGFAQAGVRDPLPYRGRPAD